MGREGFWGRGGALNLVAEYTEGMEINGKNTVPSVFSVAVCMAAVAERECNHHACRYRDGIRLFNVDAVSTRR